MSVVLYIQTALETAMVGLSREGVVIASRENPSQKDHAAFLQPAIRDICQESGIHLRDISAVTVVNGPGSYTGLRVGLSAAKGICFALNKPLITLSTLEWMAMAGKDTDVYRLAPMIDARRMEVFTALYDTNGNCITPPFATILDETLFLTALDNGKILFFGGGAAKFKSIQRHSNAVFAAIDPRAEDLAQICWNLLQQRVFSDLSTTSPFYGKAFHSTQKPSIP